MPAKKDPPIREPVPADPRPTPTARRSTVRLAIPRTARPVPWNDLYLGQMMGDPARLGGDFPVARHGLGPSYQLAVVVDDALMGVNQVIRGDDLVPSTPRQILLHQGARLEASAVWPCSACRHNRWPSPGQAQRIDQAGDPARARR